MLHLGFSYPIGIAIGTGSVHAAQLRATAAGPQVRALLSRPMAAGSQAPDTASHPQHLAVIIPAG